MAKEKQFNPLIYALGLPLGVVFGTMNARQQDNNDDKPPHPTGD